MRKHGHAAHDGPHGVRIQYTLLNAWEEESRLAAAEVVVEVDQEGVEGGLFCSGGRGVVEIGGGGGVDSRGGPRAV